MENSKYDFIISSGFIYFFNILKAKILIMIKIVLSVGAMSKEKVFAIT